MLKWCRSRDLGSKQKWFIARVLSMADMDDIPACQESGNNLSLFEKQAQTSTGLSLRLGSPHKPNPYITTKSESLSGQCSATFN